jgi:hypothetical protein
MMGAWTCPSTVWTGPTFHLRYQMRAFCQHQTRDSTIGVTKAGVDFWFLSLLQLNLYWQKNSKIQVEKSFFFLF